MTMDEMLTALDRIKGCGVMIHRSDIDFDQVRFTCHIKLARAGCEIKIEDRHGKDETVEQMFRRCYERFMKAAQATELVVYLAPPVEAQAIEHANDD